MPEEKRCRTVRDHKPHLWSRTTRKTVTEVTPGDTFECPGRARESAEVAEEGVRRAQIAADARSGRNWAAETGYGAGCRCGIKTNPTSVGYGKDDGRCYRHDP